MADLLLIDLSRPQFALAAIFCPVFAPLKPWQIYFRRKDGDGLCRDAFPVS